jgi:hypothetical protein
LTTHGEKPIFLASTFIRGDGLRLQIELMNPNDENAYLYLHTNVGIVTQVCSVDPMKNDSNIKNIKVELIG